MSYRIDKVGIVGAGTMGGGIAAHLANIGIPVVLLDIVPPDLSEAEKNKPAARNRIVNSLYERMVKARPANLARAEDGLKSAIKAVETISANPKAKPEQITAAESARDKAAARVPEAKAQLEAAKTPPKVVWVKPAALHVTVRFIGEVDAPEVERLTALLAPPIAVAPFELAWRGIGTFPSAKHPRALWLGVTHGAAPLAQVEAEVSRRLAEARESIGPDTLGELLHAGDTWTVSG